MPIQLVSTYKKIPPPPVDLVTAGADLFPVCNLIITLSATVSPIENIQGHTIFWEQLSGTPVVLSVTDELVTTYTQITNDETDKEFRITIDKDLPEEQSDTLIVYATPTSLPEKISFPSAGENKIASDAVIDLDVDTTASFPPPQNVIDNDVNVTPLFIVNWSQPPDVLLQPYVVGYSLYENDILVATYDAGDLLEYSGGNLIYQVETHFVVNGTAPYQSSSERGYKQDFADVVVPSTIVLDDMVNPATFPKVVPTITVFQNTFQRLEDIVDEAAFITVPEVTRYIINSVGPGDETAYTFFSNGESIITRLDPGGIGGG